MARFFIEKPLPSNEPEKGVVLLPVEDVTDDASMSLPRMKCDAQCEEFSDRYLRSAAVLRIHGEAAVPSPPE